MELGWQVDNHLSQKTEVINNETNESLLCSRFGKSLHIHQTFCYSFQSEFLLLPQNSNFWMSTRSLHINLVSYCVSGGGMALSFSSGHQLKCLSTLLCTSSIAVVLLWLVWLGFVVQHHQTLQCPSQTATKKKRCQHNPSLLTSLFFRFQIPVTQCEWTEVTCKWNGFMFVLQMPIGGQMWPWS